MAHWHTNRRVDFDLNVATLPFIHKHVAVMPDVHWGMGATVGSVIPTLGAAPPAARGEPSWDSWARCP